MKHPAGNAPPRRLAAQRKQVRLHLRRQAAPEPDEEVGTGQKSHFWKWVAFVALLHLGLLTFLYYLYEASPSPPPQSFMELLPPGEVVKGKPGIQEAPKLGPTTAAPSIHHVSPPPVPAVQPPTPVVKTEAPAPVPDKPVPQPTPPKPKVKVDLTLADGPAPATEKHAPKPKPHVKKPVPATPTPDANAPDRATTANPNSTGLSKEQIANKLGQKLEAAGVENSVKIGSSGSEHSTANPFQDFYLSVRDQVMNKWQHPDLTDESAVDPEVTIHVEKDGRVPPESVTLTRSSGNQVYDDSAVAAAKSLGYLLQPLPDGCPPDIHITFKLTR